MTSATEGVDGWSVFSSLPQPLVALPAFAFVAFLGGLVPLGLGFAGGAMLWMVAAQVVPDALRTSSRRVVAVALGASTLAMLALEVVLVALATQQRLRISRNRLAGWHGWTAAVLGDTHSRSCLMNALPATTSPTTTQEWRQILVGVRLGER